MRQFGLIGQKLSHSYSKLYFDQLFAEKHLNNCQYDLFELKRMEDFPDLLREHPNLCGLNITIPYKKAILPFLDEIDPAAQSIGAVNVINISRKNGTPHLIGYNTDHIGFRDSIADKAVPQNALILGTGGAAAAVAYALNNMHIHYLFVSRVKSYHTLTYNELTRDLLQKNSFIINCTPVGMYPSINHKPLLPYKAITKDYYLYDLIYNPAVTEFIQEGISHGATVQNGIQMLHLQALEAKKIWKL